VDGRLHVCEWSQSTDPTRAINNAEYSTITIFAELASDPRDNNKIQKQNETKQNETKRNKTKKKYKNKTDKPKYRNGHVRGQVTLRADCRHTLQGRIGKLFKCETIHPFKFPRRPEPQTKEKEEFTQQDKNCFRTRTAEEYYQT
jgi:hypothetical protein